MPDSVERMLGAFLTRTNEVESFVEKSADFDVALVSHTL